MKVFRDVSQMLVATEADRQDWPGRVDRGAPDGVVAMSRRGWALFVAVGVTWGIPFLLIKVADSGVSVTVLVFARVFIGSLLLVPLAVRRGRLRSLLPRWRWLVALSVVEVILPWLLLSAAERRLSSSLSGLLVAVVPIIGVGVARLAGDREPMSAARWAGLVIGLGGVTLLLLPAVTSCGTVPVLEAFGTAVCYAIGPAIASQKLAEADDLSVTAASLGLASVVYCVPAALTWPQAVPPVRVLAALAGLAAICTALAFLLYLQLIAEAGPVRAEVVTYVNPAVAVTLGVLVLGEPFTSLIAISFALILVGSVLSTRRGNQPAREALDDLPASARRQTLRTCEREGLLDRHGVRAAPARTPIATHSRSAPYPPCSSNVAGAVSPVAMSSPSLAPAPARDGRIRRASSTSCTARSADSPRESPPRSPGARVRSCLGSSRCCPAPRRRGC